MISERRQASVVPYRVRAGRLELALVTSLSGKRWILPKGTVEPGEQPRQTAERETEEEAGLRGELGPEPVGSYRVSKDGNLFAVDVFLMQVTTEYAEWPERELRRRRWLELNAAVLRLDGELRRIVVRATRDLGHDGTAS